MDVGHIFQCIAVSFLLFVRQANLPPCCQDEVPLVEKFMVLAARVRFPQGKSDELELEPAHAVRPNS
jgi:hypothetical protein